MLLCFKLTRHRYKAKMFLLSIHCETRDAGLITNHSTEAQTMYTSTPYDTVLYTFTVIKVICGLTTKIYK